MTKLFLTKLLLIILKTCVTVLSVGFTLTAISLYINESDIAYMFTSITVFICLPLLLIAIGIDYKRTT